MSCSETGVFKLGLVGLGCIVSPLSEVSHIDRMNSMQFESRPAGRNQPKTRAPKGSRLSSESTRIARVGARLQKSYQPQVGSRLNKAVRQMSLGSGPMVGASSAYSSVQKTANPRISADENSSRVVHRELIASVSGTPSFTIENAFPLNPGMAATFPWLSSIAQNWEQYRFNKLRFCYYTRTGTSTAGSVQMIPDYDAADSAPTTEMAASSYSEVVEDAPWKDLCCDLRPSSLHALGPRKYTRTAALAANLDIKTYDAGTFFLATTDGSSVPWGKLWVEYDVTFFTPQVPNATVTSLSAVLHATSTTPTSSNILPSSTVVSGTLGVSVIGSVIVFPSAGVYSVSYTGTGSNVNSSTPITSAGASFDSSFNNGSGWSETGSGTAVSTVLAIVNCSGPGGKLTLAETYTAGSYAELLVVLLPPSAV